MYPELPALRRCFNGNRVAENRFLAEIHDHVYNGEKYFKSLGDSDKRNLVGLMLDALDEQTLHEFWIEMDNVKNILKSYAKAERCYSNENKDDFYLAFSDSAIKRFESHIQDLFDEIRGEKNDAA